MAGETLRSIGQQHRIPLQALEAANPNSHCIKLVPESILCLPNDVTDMTSKQETMQLGPKQIVCLQASAQADQIAIALATF